jgi:hypothetical protein
MILSRRHRFVFLEVPQTGTTAIAQELRESYGAEDVLHKHAHLREFLRVASPEERRYRVALSVRHPLDRLYSYYRKLLVDHRGEFSDPGRWVENGGWVTPADRERREFLREHGDDFGAYLRRFHVGRPPAISQYNWGKRRHGFCVRFERLNEDFHGLLRHMGVEPLRDLPPVNVTRGRSREFFSVYPEELRPELVRLFGPLAHEWGYGFPAEWGSGVAPFEARLAYAARNLAGRTLTEVLHVAPKQLQDLRVRRLARRAAASA